MILERKFQINVWEYQKKITESCRNNTSVGAGYCAGTRPFQPYSQQCGMIPAEVLDDGLAVKKVIQWTTNQSYYGYCCIYNIRKHNNKIRS